tara:strand:- start:1248 stop:1523 length:276 start_codon:yes stop_codon:yes gene_type:complete
MLLEAIDFLAREVIADKAIEGLARRVDRMSPGAGAIVTRVYVGAALGKGFGTYAGKQSAANFRQGKMTVSLDYTPEIQAYDRSALRTSRII